MKVPRLVHFEGFPAPPSLILTTFEFRVDCLTLQIKTETISEDCARAWLFQPWYSLHGGVLHPFLCTFAIALTGMTGKAV